MSAYGILAQPEDLRMLKREPDGCMTVVVSIIRPRTIRELQRDTSDILQGLKTWEHTNCLTTSSLPSLAASKNKQVKIER